MILMWLGELITEQSVGNGISLVITVGIVSSLPKTVGSILNSVVKRGEHWIVFGHNLPVNKTALIYGLIIAAVVILLTIAIVKLNEASRKITINYAKRVQGNRTYGGVTTVLPVKLITAGVIPIIFAVAFLSVPSFAGQLMIGNSSARLKTIGSTLVRLFQNPSAQSFAQSTLNIRNPHTWLLSTSWQPYVYPLMYFVLVVIFTFFYTGIAFNAKEIAENLHKQGGFIENVRSGQQTEKYLSRLVNRLTLFGAFALGILAILPIIGQIFLQTNITIGGTSILILVSVALETLRQIESRALMVTYDQYSEPDFFTDIPDSDKVKKSKLRRLKLRKN